MTDHDCPHAVTLRNLLDACERGRPLTDVTDRLRVEVGRLVGEGTTQPDPKARTLVGDLDMLEYAIADYIAKWGEHWTGRPYLGEFGPNIAGMPTAVANMAMTVIRKNLGRASGEGTAPQVPAEVLWEGDAWLIAEDIREVVPPGTTVQVVVKAESPLALGRRPPFGVTEPLWEGTMEMLHRTFPDLIGRKPSTRVQVISAGARCHHCLRVVAADGAPAGADRG